MSSMSGKATVLSSVTTVGSRDTAVLPLSIAPREFHQLPGQMRERGIQKASKGYEKLNKIMWT